jgi:hypothetical protein
MIRMKTPWHPPVSIKAMFQQIEDGVKFATAGNDAPSANTTVRIGYNIIYATGRFTIGCHEWRKLTDEQKTWAQLKTHFKAADTDLRLMTTSNSAGYDGAANHVQASDDNSTALATSQAALAASQAALAAALQGQANLVTSTPAATSTRRTNNNNKDIFYVISPILHQLPGMVDPRRRHYQQIVIMWPLE